MNTATTGGRELAEIDNPQIPPLGEPEEFAFARPLDGKRAYLTFCKAVCVEPEKSGHGLLHHRTASQEKYTAIVAIKTLDVANRAEADDAGKVELDGVTILPGWLNMWTAGVA